MATAPALLFSALARLLADEARQRGLLAPAFRCPPRADNVARAIRRFPGGGAVVAVRVRGREPAAVVADMVEGVIVTNGLEGDEAAAMRAELVAAAAPLTEPGHKEAA
jgi:hypothetical protein